ncbi:STE3-domain-containing protein [Corynespora cassiicola Philippines]|uniref:STE3-domain-containing protein n=1 Tax=Corynespora cassiicola Philippines TaxID=1448308 RepID=A0A2T2P0K1_CORCC|nr:STE3-domain-containing protein [Corynespora cassiicola Philippines]
MDSFPLNLDLSQQGFQPRGEFNSTMSDPYPIYTASVLLPILAFPAWILNILPMAVHFWQGNIAAGLAIAWYFVINIFNSVNPLIWPRDNILEWFSGNIYCDISVHIYAGAIVGPSATVSLIMWKLAKVMDTRNITVSQSRSNRRREKLLEIFFGVVYPCIMMITYYIVQPIRYFVFGIVGCTIAFDDSWPTLVVNYMWGPITILVGAYWAVVLLYRLHRYRSEFGRLVAANNSTTSRFLRLMIMALIIIIACTSYSLFIFYRFASDLASTYDWDVVHGPRWNTYIQVPSNGSVSYDRWGHVIIGYLAFIVLGTGSDALYTYRKMLIWVGLGNWFPRLYNGRETSSPTSSTRSFARSFYSNVSEKAKGIFWRKSSMASILPTSTWRSNSVHLDVSTNIHLVRSISPIIHAPDQHTAAQLPSPGRFDRLLDHFFNFIGNSNSSRHRRPAFPLVGPAAPLRSLQTMTANGQHIFGNPKLHAKPYVATTDLEMQSHAWYSGPAVPEPAAQGHAGVRVVQEVRQDRRDRTARDDERRRDAWE